MTEPVKFSIWICINDLIFQGNFCFFNAWQNFIYGKVNDISRA